MITLGDQGPGYVPESTHHAYDAGMPLVGGELAARMDMPNILDRGLANDPGAIALQSLAHEWTWADLDAAATALAKSYRAFGLEPGDRLASLMPNRTMLALHYIACFKAGIVAVPMNYRYMQPEVEHALSLSGAKAAVIHAQREDIVSSGIAQSLPLGMISYKDPNSDQVTTGTGLLDLLRESHEIDLGQVDPEAPAILFFTSGSTGPAKGVTHSYATLGWMVAAAAAAFEMTEEDVVLPGSSMSHVGSFLWTFAGLSVGGKVVVARQFDAAEILPLLRKFRPTVLAMIPAALAAMIRSPGVTADDFTSLRVVRAGADKVSLELEDEFSHLVGFLINEGYGMTEVGIASLNPPRGEIRRGSIGTPNAGYLISLRDDEGNEVDPGVVGRIWMKSPTQTIGYWNDPSATAEIFDDGWLDSGDLAHADEDGYLWFFGRRKQIIVHDGSNISPYEVEGALLEHPAVEACGVVGIHDLTHGENVRAYVVLRDGSEPVSELELAAFAKERIGYKAPEEIVIIDEMPLNPTGKVDRNGLKKMAEADLHPHLP